MSPSLSLGAMSSTLSLSVMSPSLSLTGTAMSPSLLLGAMSPSLKPPLEGLDGHVIRYGTMYFQIHISCCYSIPFVNEQFFS